MASGSNDQCIDDKIMSIKETLHQLGSSFFPSRQDTPEPRGHSVGSDHVVLRDSFVQRLEGLTGTDLHSESSSLIHYTESPSMDAIKRDNSDFLTSPWITGKSYDSEKIATLEQRIVQKDELLSEMSRLQKELREKLQREKIKRSVLKDQVIDLNEQLACKTEELSKYSDYEITKGKEAQQKISTLEERIAILERCQQEFLHENDSLYKQIAEKDRRLSRLQEKLDEASQKDSTREKAIISLQRERVALLKDLDHNSAQVTPLKHRNRSVSPGKHPNPMCSPEVMREQIRTLKKRQESSSTAILFVDKVSSLMTKINPGGSKKPSLRRIWNWIKWLLEEYMSSKENEPTAQLQKILGVEDAVELVKQVKRLKSENKQYSDLMMGLSK